MLVEWLLSRLFPTVFFFFFCITRHNPSIFEWQEHRKKNTNMCTPLWALFLDAWKMVCLGGASTAWASPGTSVVLAHACASSTKWKRLREARYKSEGVVINTHTLSASCITGLIWKQLHESQGSSTNVKMLLKEIMLSGRCKGSPCERTAPRIWCWWLFTVSKLSYL